MRRVIVGLCLIALAAPGCWTSKDEGEALRRDIEELKAAMSGQLQRAGTERKKLQKIMEQATGLLTRNSADTGAQVERVQERLDKLAGRMDESTRRLDELNKAFAEYQGKVDVKLEGLTSGAAKPKKADPVPMDKNKLFASARTKLSAGEHEEGRRLMRHFLSRHGTTPEAPRAQRMLGDSYYAEERFAPAIQEYRKVVQGQKTSKEVPEALYKIGMSFYQLKYCSDAGLFFKLLLKKHRRHRQAKNVKKVMKLMRKYKRDRRFCVS